MIIVKEMKKLPEAANCVNLNLTVYAIGSAGCFFFATFCSLSESESERLHLEENSEYVGEQ